MRLLVWATVIGVLYFTIAEGLAVWVGALIVGFVLLLHYLSFRARHAGPARSQSQGGSDYGTSTPSDGWSGSGSDRSFAPATGAAPAAGRGGDISPGAVGVGAWLGALWAGDASASDGSAGDTSGDSGGGDSSGGDSGGGGDGGGGGGD